MRAGLVALIVFVALRAELPRARANEDAALTILIHPRVVTTLQLPDEIVHTWIDHHGETRVARIRDKLYIRPRPGTPAGVTALLEVETRTARWTFRLRVVARSRDASPDVRVLPVEAPVIAVEAPVTEEATPEAPPAAPVESEASSAAPTKSEAPREASAEPVTRATAEPAASAPSLAPPESIAGPTPAEPTAGRTTATAIEPATASTGASRFDLAAHVVGGLGFNGANIARYRSETALQPHYSLGLRLTGEPRATWWAMQADVNAEWPAGPMLYQGQASRLEVSGPRLRLEVGTRASVGTKWKASVYVGGGIQVHLRRAEETYAAPASTLEQGAVLAMGVGLRYRGRRRVLLGLDFLVRQGWPDDYLSVAALLTVGRFLEQGD